MTDSKTPIQQAIIAIAQSSDGGKNKAYAEAIVILRRLLPTEKEFVSQVFDAGEKYGSAGWQVQPNRYANKQQLIDKLYNNG